MRGLFDTMNDLVVGLVGSVVHGGLYYYLVSRTPGAAKRLASGMRGLMPGEPRITTG